MLSCRCFQPRGFPPWGFSLGKTGGGGRKGDGFVAWDAAGRDVWSRWAKTAPECEWAGAAGPKQAQSANAWVKDVWTGRSAGPKRPQSANAWVMGFGTRGLPGPKQAQSANAWVIDVWTGRSAGPKQPQSANGEGSRWQNTPRVRTAEGSNDKIPQECERPGVRGPKRA